MLSPNPFSKPNFIQFIPKVNYQPGEPMYKETFRSTGDNQPTTDQQESYSMRQFKALEKEAADRDHRQLESLCGSIDHLKDQVDAIVNRPKDTFPNGAIIIASRDVDDWGPTKHVIAKSDEGVWHLTDINGRLSITSWPDILTKMEDLRQRGHELALVQSLYVLPEGPLTELPINPTGSARRPAKKAAAKKTTAKKTAVKR